MYVYESNPIEIEESNEDIVRGISYQILFGSAIKLNVGGRRDFELGRVLALALQVKCEIEGCPNLGPASLARNNQLFGNYPRSRGSKVNDQPAYEIKMRWNRFFKSDPDKLKEKLWGVFFKLVESIGLSRYDDRTYNKLISQNVSSMDFLIKSNTRLVKHTNRKGREIKDAMLPSLPKRSPVLTKHESDLIYKLARPLWDSLDDFKKSYEENLSSLGFDVIRHTVRNIYMKRWEFLSKYSAMTTARLQEFRKALGPEASKNAKRDFTVESTLQAISARTNMVKDFVNEISQLFDEDLRQIILQKEYGLASGTKLSWTFLIKQDCQQAYARDQLEFLDKTLPEEEKIELTMPEVNRALSSLNKVLKSSSNLSEKSRYLTCEHKGIEALKTQCTHIIINYVEARKELLQLPSTTKKALSFVKLSGLQTIDELIKRSDKNIDRVIEGVRKRNLTHHRLQKGTSSVVTFLDNLKDRLI
jgi:hypothetical protein